jgi:hypothetical protein
MGLDCEAAWATYGASNPAQSQNPNRFSKFIYLPHCRTLKASTHTRFQQSIYLYAITGTSIRIRPV